MDAHMDLPRQALFDACMRGDAARAQKMLALGANPGASLDESSEYSCLHLAVMEGHHACVHALVVARADPNAASDLFLSPLTIACVKDHVECVATLLAGGADPSFRPSHIAGSPLEIAQRHGHTRCAALIADAISARRRAAHAANAAAVDVDALCERQVLPPTCLIRKVIHSPS